MSVVGQLHSSRQLNRPILQWMLVLFGEFNSFLWPKLSPAAQCHVQNIVIPSLAIHKIGRYHRSILKSLLKPRAGCVTFGFGLFVFHMKSFQSVFFSVFSSLYAFILV